MPAANLAPRADLYLPLSPPLARVFWLLAALVLWLSLSACCDAILVFNDATTGQPGDLKTVTFTIVEVARRTPNFKVRLSDGATASLSFPDRRGGNPKGGLEMVQISSDAREQLTGCVATAKIRSVFSAYGRRNQVWDLDCPQAHLHYGPAVAASAIRAHPRVDLVVNLLFAVFFLCSAAVLAVFARKLAQTSAVLPRA
ncbi:hypothetical protein [Massilia sp. PWRC2]|uniref:hypothetical protein n=1 Tax=Massilia sp. PWRC2 TaxID=2804626 RepID=UPI003CF26944